MMRLDKKLERFSVLIDSDNLSESELEEIMFFLLDDLECQQVWQEYHIIRSCLTKESVRFDLSVRSAVRDKLLAMHSVKTVNSQLNARSWFKKSIAAASITVMGLSIFYVIYLIGHLNKSNFNSDLIAASLLNSDTNLVSLAMVSQYLNQDSSSKEYGKIKNRNYAKLQSPVENNKYLKIREDIYMPFRMEKNYEPITK